MTTEDTPTIIPRVVRLERVRLRHSECSASVKYSPNGPISCSPHANRGHTLRGFVRAIPRVRPIRLRPQCSSLVETISSRTYSLIRRMILRISSNVRLPAWAAPCARPSLSNYVTIQLSEGMGLATASRLKVSGQIEVPSRAIRRAAQTRCRETKNTSAPIEKPCDACRGPRWPYVV